MQRKIFKFKIISKEGYCTLSLDYTNLTNEIIRPITASLIKIEPNEKCKLLFVGKERHYKIFCVNGKYGIQV